MSTMYPEYAQWLRQVRRSTKLPKAVKLLKGDEYTSAVPYRFGEPVEFGLAGVAVSVRTAFRTIR